MDDDSLPRAVFDERLGQWISDAQVAEVPLHRVHLQAATRTSRHAATTMLLDALGRAGTVEDAWQHSNKQVAVRFSVASGGAGKLRRELEALPLRLSEASEAELEALNADAPIAGWLVLTFIHDEPDLRVAVPAVPG